MISQNPPANQRGGRFGGEPGGEYLPGAVDVPNVGGPDAGSGTHGDHERRVWWSGTVTQQASATVPAGEVISQNPQRGQRGRRFGGEPGGVDRPGAGDVPNVVGLTQAAAPPRSPMPGWCWGR